MWHPRVSGGERGELEEALALDVATDIESGRNAFVLLAQDRDPVGFDRTHCLD